MTSTAVTTTRTDYRTNMPRVHNDVPQRRMDPDLEAFLRQIIPSHKIDCRIVWPNLKVAELKEIIRHMNCMQLPRLQVSYVGRKEKVVANIKLALFGNNDDSTLEPEVRAVVTQYTLSLHQCMAQTTIGFGPVPFMPQQHTWNSYAPYPQMGMPLEWLSPTTNNSAHAAAAPTLLQQANRIEAAAATPNRKPAMKRKSPDSNHRVTMDVITTTPAEKRVRVKKEPVYDYGDESSPSAALVQTPAATNHDTTPQTPIETTLLQQLQEMGFTDKSEILHSIRKLTPACGLPHPSVDQVMIDLITGREEAEEARKMDEARKQSERTRKLESQRLRAVAAREHADALGRASWSDWLSNSSMYPKSWLLRQPALQSRCESRVAVDQEVKDSLLKVLELEKKACQWYGSVLPQSYFGMVADRLVAKWKRGNPQNLLSHEASLLQTAIYTLSEQRGGVPKIFLDAHDENCNAGSDDDDVIVVSVAQSSAAKPKKTGKNPSKSAQFVIELD